MDQQEINALSDALLTALPERPGNRDEAVDAIGRALRLLGETTTYSMANDQPMLFAITDDDVLFTVRLASTGKASVLRRPLDRTKIVATVEISGLEPGDPATRETYRRVSRWTFDYEGEPSPLITLTGSTAITGFGKSPDQPEEFARDIASRAGWLADFDA